MTPDNPQERLRSIPAGEDAELVERLYSIADGKVYGGTAAEAEIAKNKWFATHLAHREACDALGRANGELFKRALEAERSAESAEALSRQQAEEIGKLKEAAGYYIDRLKAVISGKPVRDLGEAEAAYLSALSKEEQP